MNRGSCGNSAVSTSATVLEATGIHPRPLGRAMRKVVAALCDEGSGPSRVYGVVVYRKHHKERRPDYLDATGNSF